MPRSRPGSGSVFQRTYRDSHGKLRKTKNWYIEFVSGNRTVREATPFLKRSDAAEFLKQRHSDSLAGKIPLAKGVTYDDLAELIVNDYRNNGRKSIWSEYVRLPKLGNDDVRSFKRVDEDAHLRRRWAPRSDGPFRALAATRTCGRNPARTDPRLGRGTGF
jgi:hypothetical protein